MANNALKKITTRAKQLQKKHPNTKWTSLIKKAGAEYRNGSIGTTRKKSTRKPKKKNYRQTGTSNRKNDEARHAKKPGKRKGYYERRKNRSDAPGKLTGVSAASLGAELKRRLVEKIDANVVRKYHATKKPLKRKYQKVISETKTKLRRLQ